MRTVALVSYWCRGRCSCCFSFAALSSSSFSSSSLVLLYEWQSDIAVMYLNKKSMGFLVHAHRRSLRMLAPTPVLLQLERCSSFCVCVCATLSYYDPYMYIQVIELGLSRLEKQRLGLMGTLLFAIVNHSTNHVGNVLPAYNDGDTRCPNVCPCPIARALFVPSCVLRFTL